MTDCMSRELKWAYDFVRISSPRTLAADSSKSKVVILTDAALEQNDTVGTVGLVAVRIVDDKVVERFFFADTAPKEIMALMQNVSKRAIAGLELLAGVVAVVLFRRMECLGRMFLFVDNEAARASLISMNSSVDTHNALLKFLNEVASQQSLFLWAARVPSASNLADKPSRLIFDHLEASGFTRLLVPWYDVRDWLARHA